MCVMGLVACFPRIFYEAERSEEAERSHASARSGKAAMPHGKPPIDASMVQQMVLQRHIDNGRRCSSSCSLRCTVLLS